MSMGSAFDSSLVSSKGRSPKASKHPAAQSPSLSIRPLTVQLTKRRRTYRRLDRRFSGVDQET